MGTGFWDQLVSIVLLVPDSLWLGLQKPCGSCAAGQLQAGRTEAMRPGSLDTSCMPGMTYTAAMAE